ncbi:MAG TPA: class I SAM-dependent methyltransferase [Candidatus Contendobacter sp.]|nr:class I SAM-dependent methyltransferase [Candidatus Contendobacter sp.]HRD48136.1 class I SAM-dependent methyltransferase [Candidatus Contendobacter sp.]
MSGFSAEWLSLREPADSAARNLELTARLLEWRQRRGALTVLDLASGTGANCRFLAPLLGGEQHWRLVDHDLDLLARSKAEMQPWANAAGHCSLEWLHLDLVRDWERLKLRGVQLVTASALLDLVSADWLESLARRCGQWRAAVYIVLSYDGDMVWQPALAGDERLREWVNQHQRGNKGFGPALGPDAAAALATLLQQQGYAVRVQPSPWRLEPEQAAMQTALLDGWIEAAREIAPEAAGELANWLMQRRRWIECGQSRLQVGHWDLWAWPDYCE